MVSVQGREGRGGREGEKGKHGPGLGCQKEGFSPTRMASRYIFSMVFFSPTAASCFTH